MARPKVGDMDDKKRQYGMWLGLPKECRKDDERSEETLAKKIGVALPTLTRWKKDPIVIETAESAVKFYGGNDKMDIIQALTKKAKTGDVHAIKTYLEWQGELGTSVKKKDLPHDIAVTIRTV